MKRALLTFLGLLAGLSAVAAQVPPFPTSLPSNTVVGNLSPVTGPGRAVSLASLQAAILSAAETTVADANYTALTTDRNIVYTSLTTSRTVSLPPAASYLSGTRIFLWDRSGSASLSVTISVLPSGSDTINGTAGSAVALTASYLVGLLESDGVSKWTLTYQYSSAIAVTGPGSALVASFKSAANAAADTGITGTATGTTVNIFDGQTGVGNASVNPSVLIYRNEHITSGFNTTSATLWAGVTSINQTAGSQSLAIVGAAAKDSTSTGDVLGVQGTAQNFGTNGTAFGMNPNATSNHVGSTTTGAKGMEVDVGNGTGTNQPWQAGGSFVGMHAGIDILYNGTLNGSTSALGTGGIVFRTLNNQWDVGVAFTNTSPIKSANIYNEDNSANLWQVASGTHTFGLNWTSGTFTTAIATPGFTVSGNGNTTISPASGGALLTINAPTGNAANIGYSINSSTKWFASIDSTGLYKLVDNVLNKTVLSSTSNSGIVTLGGAGSLTGQLAFGGATSGTATITAQATAGSPTLTLPNASGTFAVSASSPLALSATTGALTCTTCATTTNGGALSGTSPITLSAGGAIGLDQTANYSWTGTHTWTVAQTITSAGAAVWRNLFVAPATTTVTGTTTINNFRAIEIGTQTVTDVSAVTISDAATLFVNAAPAAAGSVTITRPWSIWANGGNVLLGTAPLNTTTANIGRLNINSASQNVVIQAGSTVSNTSVSTYYQGPVFFYELGDNTVNNTQAFDFRSVSGNSYATIGAQITDVTSGLVKGKIFFGVTNASGAATSFVYIEPTGGMNVGTDSDPGAGTINATSGYKANGTSGVSTVCTVTAGNSYTFTFGLLTTKGANCT